MEKGKNKALGSVLALLIIFALSCAGLLGLNALTAPIAEKNGSAQALAPLFAVMPDAKGFEKLYDAEDGGSYALSEVPDTVRSIYGETSGLGYALRLSTTEGYTHEPIELTMAVDNEGRIAGIQVDAYPDTKDFGQDTYPASFMGKDSALADVGLVAGVTYSSSAFRNAVSDGFSALIANSLVGAGVKSDDQILMELITVVYPGMANAEGVAQYEEPESAGEQYKYIVRSFKALNGGGFAHIVKAGESVCLAVCNASGSCAFYDADGQDVTDGVDGAVLDEVVSASAAEDLTETDIKKLSKLAPEGAEIAALPAEGIFSSVTGVYSVTDGDSLYYAFVARPYGYSNMPMTFYFVLDGSGAITAMNADEIILIPEYFSSYELDEPQYKAGFAGSTAESWDGSKALISGATFSSVAADTAVRDAFAAFDTLFEKGGEEQ